MRNQNPHVSCYWTQHVSNECLKIAWFYPKFLVTLLASYVLCVALLCTLLRSYSITLITTLKAALI